jgi:hypothetical protein
MCVCGVFGAECCFYYSYANCAHGFQELSANPSEMSTIFVSRFSCYTLVLIGMEQEVRLKCVEETPIMSMLSCVAEYKVHRIWILNKYLYGVYLWAGHGSRVI